ncbi:hypothetical protein ZIOFF_049833 [Zingiber officinale]|uniref:Uncharacterized protein n=1 Tax=Zingiber officinale TaxID=94328 RepID=A0A8J5FNU6_ZINOF|nr:hypothetical protein ZIOFF_049833 [Zingiber officinale]
MAHPSPTLPSTSPPPKNLYAFDLSAPDFDHLLIQPWAPLVASVIAISTIQFLTTVELKEVIPVGPLIPDDDNIDGDGSTLSMMKWWDEKVADLVVLATFRCEYFMEVVSVQLEG